MQEALIDSHHWYYSCRVGNGSSGVDVISGFAEPLLTGGFVLDL